MVLILHIKLILLILKENSSSDLSSGEYLLTIKV